MKYLLLILIVLFQFACSEENIKNDDTIILDSNKVESEYITISEDVVSKWDDINNIDSPTYYNDGTKSYIIATSKDKDYLQVYDANNLDELEKIGKSGSGETEFSRPNGIWVIDNLLLIVERDNHRVQVFTLPNYKHIGFIGYDKLIKPYGLTVYKSDEGYNLFITDDFESDENTVPNPEVLKARVKQFTFSVNGNKLNSKFIKNIGENEGKGRLFVVESIYADPENNMLLISDESNLNKNIKVYDLEKGTFIKNIGDGIFKYQAEGIALYKCSDDDGFWFTTDQDKGKNTFHIFSRKSLDYITSFYSDITQNTDGVWLTQEDNTKNGGGLFIMVNDDGGVSYYNLENLFNKLKIKCK